MNKPEMPRPVEIVGNHFIHRGENDEDARFYLRSEIEHYLMELDLYFLAEAIKSKAKP